MQPKCPGLNERARFENANRDEFEFDADKLTAQARHIYRDERRNGMSPREARLITAGLLFAPWTESARQRVGSA